MSLLDSPMFAIIIEAQLMHCRYLSIENGNSRKLRSRLLLDVLITKTGSVLSL